MSLSPLAPGGALAHAMLGYEDRPGQRKMAAEVAEALRAGGMAFIEAGTGTGKTLAYLVPAIESGLRVLISTGTKALQDQIAGSDIPMATEMLARDVPWTTLKGTANYLCQRRYHAARAAGDDTEDLEEWLRETTTGDRSEAKVSAATWQRVSTTADARLGGRCPYFERCYVTRARKRAADSQLVVVNHHLLCADRALRASGGEGVLPDVDAIIIDEAHLFSSALTEHFSQTLTGQAIANLLGDLANWSQWRGEEAHELRALVIGAGDAWRAFHMATTAGLAGKSGRVTLPPGFFKDSAIELSWFAFDDRLAELLGVLSRAAEEAEERGEETALAARVARVRDTLAAVAEDSSDRFVRFAEIGASNLLLSAAPIDVGRHFEDHFLADHKPIILTSATLACDGDFRFARNQLGIGEVHARELSIPSPFSYAEQALLYIADDLPDPREDGFHTACHRRMLELIELTHGRTLILCTSHRALDLARGALTGAIEQRVLVQGEREPAALLSEFRRDIHSVLLATGTFWQGVDIPGEALSQVILDKLPFAPPDDPLAAARARLIEERGGDGFYDYALPAAALGFAQGTGRLLRRKSDRGLISVLDRRLLSKRYGRVFLSALPADTPRTASLERARRWWRGG